MAVSKSYFMADEELGKKDDDHRPGKWRPQNRGWSSWRARGPRRRRTVLAIVACYLIYLFVKNMPTDLRPAVERFNLQGVNLKSGPDPDQQQNILLPAGPPPRSAEEEVDQHYYNGQVRFWLLAKSLYQAAKLTLVPQRSSVNKIDSTPAKSNVIFAAARLKSATDLIPVACEMARQKNNHVHFAFMGREDVSVEGILHVNGVDPDDCPVFWHDERPDYSPWSSDARFEFSISQGLAYTNAYLHPAVLITHNEALDDELFSEAIRSRAEKIGLPHIELPSGSGNYKWVADLDSSSLAAWNKIHIEIIVQAPPESAGSLIRLIKSLESADYLGGAEPGLTIELPPNPDASLLRFLAGVEWPPHSRQNNIKVRHRIQAERNAEEASIRSVESFYPYHPTYSHLLVLSPQTELSPSYFHYLRYTILKYKHSKPTSESSKTAKRLLGISLELPAMKLNDKEPFTPPSSGPLEVSTDAADGNHMFLWQVPNSNAALYFGDKWIEFHSFMTNRLAARKKVKDQTTPSKYISKKYPAYLEYLLELMRLREYYLLYPSFPAGTDYSLATVHNEMYQPPEEFTPLSSSESGNGDEPDVDLSKPLTAGPDGSYDLGSVERPLSKASTLSAMMQQFSGETLPNLPSMPVLSYTGEPVDGESRTTALADYVKSFQKELGGCGQDGRPGDVTVGGTEDLFCLDAA